MKFHSLSSLMLVCVIALLGSGCASRANLSPMQKRQITTHQIEGSYENVYRAAMTVLQDQGYVVKNTDMASAPIVANVDRETSKSSQFWQAFWTVDVDKGTFIEATITVGTINDSLQEIRISLQETRYSRYDGGKTDIKQLVNPAAYQELANQITVETKRREALGR